LRVESIIEESSCSVHIFFITEETVFVGEILCAFADSPLHTISMFITERLTEVLEVERDAPREFQPLPFHYVEIARLLLDK
jgi:hypothetical protein